MLLQHLHDENKILLRLVNTAQRHIEGQSDKITNVQQLFNMDVMRVLEEKSLGSTGSVNNARLAWRSSGLSELSKIKDVNVKTEFVANSEVNKDEISLRPSEIRTFMVQLGSMTDTSTYNAEMKSKTLRPKIELPLTRQESNRDIFVIYLVAFALTACLISSLWHSRTKPKKNKLEPTSNKNNTDRNNKRQKIV